MPNKYSYVDLLCSVNENCLAILFLVWQCFEIGSHGFNSWFPCLYLPSAETAGPCHHIHPAGSPEIQIPADNYCYSQCGISLWHAASHTLCLCSSALGTPVPVWPWICSVFRILVSLDPRHPKFLPQATPLPSLGHRFTEVLMNIISWAGPVPGEVHVSDSRPSWHRLAIPATQETAAGKLGFQSEFKSCLSNIVRLKRANGKVQRNIAQWWSVCLTHGRP